MTDIDLDAIKARYEAAMKSHGTPDQAWRYGDSADDVPALLARLAEVEAERDVARKDVDRLAVDAANLTLELNGEMVRANSAEAKVHELAAELAAANQALKDVTDLLDEARQQRDRSSRTSGG